MSKIIEAIEQEQMEKGNPAIRSLATPSSYK